jgi:hypothetical protein
VPEIVEGERADWFLIVLLSLFLQRFETPLCCFLSVDLSTCPLCEGALNIQPSSGVSAFSHRASSTARTRGVMGRTRLAAAVFPWVIRTVPCLPFVHVTDSQRKRKHSSGRIPVSARIVTIEASKSRAAVQY